MNLRRNTLCLLLSLISVNSSPNTINLCLLKSYSVEILDNFAFILGDIIPVSYRCYNSIPPEILREVLISMGYKMGILRRNDNIAISICNPSIPTKKCSSPNSLGNCHCTCFIKAYTGWLPVITGICVGFRC